MFTEPAFDPTWTPGKPYLWDTRDERPAQDPLWFDAGSWTEGDIPKRRWLAAGYLLRGSVTLVAGAGGVSKSSLMVAYAVALALGEPFGAFRPEAPFRALTFNVEDDLTEQNRRFSAALRGFGREPADIAGKIMRVGASGVGTLLSKTETGELGFTPAMEQLEAQIKAFKPDVVFLDPFAELHDCDENSNTDVRSVAATLRALAVKHELAVFLIHHTRKGASVAGDPDSARGASSLLGAVRVALTLCPMSEDEAVSFGLAPEKRRHYCRLDGSKSNYASLAECSWFQRVPTLLDNGEMVAALEPWQPPVDVLSPETFETIKAAVAAGSASGPWSDKLYQNARSLKTLLARNGVGTKSGQLQVRDALHAAGFVVAPFRRPGHGKGLGLRSPDGRPSNVEWLPEPDEFADE